MAKFACHYAKSTRPNTGDFGGFWSLGGVCQGRVS